MSHRKLGSVSCCYCCENYDSVHFDKTKSNKSGVFKYEKI